MMRRLLAAAALLLGLQASAARAVEGKALPARDWSFSGIFGQFDRGAMQRGLQVYREVGWMLPKPSLLSIDMKP